MLPFLLLHAPAAAAVTCVSIDEFNTRMASEAGVDTVSVAFDATGVNPYAFPGTKGALVDLADRQCSGGAFLTLKVYGHEDPPNTVHPGGTLKQEYGNACCPTGDCLESWADPNASVEIFRDGTETCDVYVWIDPDTFGYRLVCDTGTFEGIGDNTYDMLVNLVSIFELTDGSTWQIPDARSTWNEVCFTPPDGGGTDTGTDTGETSTDGAGEFVATQDVTVSAAFPDQVYPDAADLSVEVGDSQAYLQFDLRSVPGRITGAELVLQASTDGSAEGTGADAVFVAENGWSEGSLTWNARPAATGGTLDRVAPIQAGQNCAWDVGAALSAPAIYTLALVPQAGDTNGVHLLSREGSSSAAPRLRVTWTDDDEPPADDTGATTDSGGDSGAGDSDAAPGDTAGEDGKDAPAGTFGCSCGTGGSANVLGLLAAASLLRRRRGA